MNSANNNSSRVNREKTTPMLIRCFWTWNDPNVVDCYRNGKLPPNEVQIYTWKDASLKEITELLSESLSSIKGSVAIHFSIIYPDRTGKNVMRPLGTVNSTSASNDEMKTLVDLGLEAGDYLDINILSNDKI